MCLSVQCIVTKWLIGSAYRLGWGVRVKMGVHMPEEEREVLGFSPIGLNGILRVIFKT